MFELKKIAPEAVPDALEKALRYRLLNEPLEAESICRDILIMQPDNQSALITLLLAVTDQFSKDYGVTCDHAREVLADMGGEYEQAYYAGIIDERWGKAQMARGMPTDTAADWIRQAMRWYEKADVLSSPDDPDAALRWNTCARFLDRRSPSSYDSPTRRLTRDVEAEYGDDVPNR